MNLNWQHGTTLFAPTGVLEILRRAPKPETIEAKDHLAYEDAVRFELEDMAESWRTTLLDNQCVRLGFYSVDRIVPENRGFFIGTCITERGELAEQAAKEGLWWSAYINAPDLNKTIDEARNTLSKRVISSNEVEHLKASLPFWHARFPDSELLDDFEIDFTLDLLTRQRSGVVYPRVVMKASVCHR